MQPNQLAECGLVACCDSGQEAVDLNPSGELTQILSGFRRPNGVILSPDGQTLYLAVSEESRIMAYDVGADGLPSNQREFAKTNGGPDGMTVDPAGNVYAAVENAVSAWDATGQRLFDLRVPQRASNVTFGGADGKTLFITAGSSLYSVQLNIAPEPGNVVLLAGNADQDLDFDQLDLVQLQVAAKYLTGQAATWGEGDWNGAPGGSPGDPPGGDGVFDQFDIIAAQQAATYLTGSYAAIQPDGKARDGQTSVVYSPATGELAVDPPVSVELPSINIDSAAGIFTGQAAQNLGGSFDHDANNNIFKATFGGSFGAMSFGNVAQAGMSEQFILGDLTVVGSLAGGGDLGAVDLIYVPEPTSALLLALGLVIRLSTFGRINRGDGKIEKPRVAFTS